MTNHQTVPVPGPGDDPAAPERWDPQDLKALAASPVLQGFTAGEIEQLAHHMQRGECDAGTVVVREGDASGDMYVILAGEAMIQRRELDLHRIGPGGHFGELAMVHVQRRSATVRAVTRLSLARLARTAFASLLREERALAVRLLQGFVASLGDQLVEMTDSVERLLAERTLPRRVEVVARIGGVPSRVATGTLVGALLPRAVDGDRVVAALMGNRPVSLETPLCSDADIAPLTLASREGRHIYRRSLGILLLEATRRVSPGLDVRLGPSISFGQVVIVTAGVPDARVRLAIEREMRGMVSRREDLREEVWTVDEARLHLRQQGAVDAAALLDSARSATVTLLCCGQTHALCPGPMLVDASEIGDFRLLHHPAGLLLDFGPEVGQRVRGSPASAAVALEHEVEHPRFGGPAVMEHAAWLEAMGVRSVGRYNELCVSGQVPQLVRIAEGFQEKRIGAIADAIQGRCGSTRLVLIAGPSASGKTTFIRRLTVQLAIHGIQSVIIGLDDYYVDRQRTPRAPDGAFDFEALEAIDLALLRGHLEELLAGRQVTLARYDFRSGTSFPVGGRAVQLGARDVVILEGIHGLNPQLLDGTTVPSCRYGIFLQPTLDLPLDALTSVSPADVRLLRRIVRDRHGRAISAADNIRRWPAVRAGERAHIYPHQHRADALFDSSLVYELSVLKVFGERYLLEVPRDDPAFPTAYRLRQLLDQFVTIYPDHVPPNSVLREFIGGSGFEY